MHDSNHHHTGQEHQVQSKEEVAAYLRYTLHHNEHHQEELAGLLHNLEHLQLDEAAAVVRLCMEDYRRGNKRLESVLALLNA